MTNQPFWRAVILSLVLSGLALAAKPGRSQTSPLPADEPGPEVCAACHEDLVRAFKKSAHQAILFRKNGDAVACSSCHGSGKEHAETTDPSKIRNPRKLAVADADAACAVCHQRSGKTSQHLSNSHVRQGVACFQCHAIHEGASLAAAASPSTPLVRPSFLPRSAPLKLVTRSAADVTRLCVSCHTAEWAQFQQPHTHPVASGAMSCTDCHSPHGSTLRKGLAAVGANQVSCLKCHGDKRGPFVYEHPSLRIEGCTACHLNHGSPNPFLLTRHEVRFICLECHSSITPTSVNLAASPASFHDLRAPRYQNCTTCHIKIHGSQTNRSFLR